MKRLSWLDAMVVLSAGQTLHVLARSLTYLLLGPYSFCPNSRLFDLRAGYRPEGSKTSVNDHSESPACGSKEEDVAKKANKLPAPASVSGTVNSAKEPRED